MPRLQIHRKGTVALATTLIHLASRVVEDTKHRRETVGSTIRATDDGTLRTDVAAMKADATCVLADERTIAERLVNARNTVIGHRKEKAGA